MKPSEIHTPQCFTHRINRLVATISWLDQWPLHCPSCDGEGGTLESTPLGSLVFWECPDCVLEGICPRCGANTFDNYTLVETHAQCSSCGWNWNLEPSSADMRPLPAASEGPCICGSKDHNVIKPEINGK